MPQSSSIAIARDIPPPDRKDPVSKPRYPWRDLKPGDSFLHPGSRWAASSLMSYVREETGWVLCSRKEGDQIRIWRVA